MASIIDTYTARYYQLTKEQLNIPKYIRPSKLDNNQTSKITRPICLKKSNSELENLISTTSKLKLRLLVYKEDSDGSRSNIFDSEKCQTNSLSSPKKPMASRSMPKSSNITQTSTKLNNEVIKRMVFGSFPMKVCNNTAIKVHSLKNSSKTMISNVFTYFDTTKINQDNCFCDENEQNSSPKLLNLTKTKTIPIKKAQSRPIQSNSFTSSNHNFNLISPGSSVPSNTMFYGSYAGIYKRLMRSVSNSLISDNTSTVHNTSIDQELMNFNDLIDSTSSRNSHENRSLYGSNNGSVQQSLCEKCIENNCYPKYKIGVAVVFCLPNRQRNSSLSENMNLNNNENFYEFFFSHLPLIEHQFKELIIDKLNTNLPVYFSNKFTHRVSITSSSSLNASNFAKRLLSDFENFERKFNLLYLSPRLNEPAWLGLIKSKSKNLKNDKLINNSLINNFEYLNNLKIPNSPNSSSSSLFKKILTNEKNFNKEKLFLKNILSALLNNHLSWVLTVLPANEIIENNSDLNLRKQQANWTRILEKTNPYNPLWAQLGDLHGAVNQPLKLVRCVVVGKNRDLIERILNICSYFIRCGNSNFYDIQQENFDFSQLIKTNDETSIRINLKEISELKYDPLLQLTSVFNTSSLSSSSRSGNSSVSVSTSTSPVSKLDIKNSSPSNAQELPLIGCKLKPNLTKSTRMQDNFGYSLLASYCDEFVFEFVLHGTSEMNFLDDLHQRLVFSKNNSILDCPINESKYIVIDADQFEVKVYSSESSKPFLVEKPIGLVDSLVQSVLSMIDLFQNSEFVLLHLEDKLQEFYTKSLAMSQIKSQSQEISDEKLMKLIDINDVSDLEFLRQIHSAVKIPDFF